SDAASVCYRAMEETRTDGSDVVLIDTAGRLHTKKHLMDELEKIVRVIKKVEPDAPHETLLVLDATTGQNAMNQAKTFAEIGGVTGIVMTKLDGTAKGGILIALRDQFDMPVLMIGVGETADDLRPFDAQEFIDALFTEEE
ncbi:MAG: signal recognition particle-docking protein FtsY, partial [Candidatus Sumerlaeota bacterium]|nr:signal recognition particle-docking protein FtsY [Candidatus Sumerlaeota bacterium]